MKTLAMRLMGETMLRAADGTGSGISGVAGTADVASGNAALNPASNVASNPSGDAAGRPDYDELVSRVSALSGRVDTLTGENAKYAAQLDALDAARAGAGSGSAVDDGKLAARVSRLEAVNAPFFDRALADYDAEERRKLAAEADASGHP